MDLAPARDGVQAWAAPAGWGVTDWGLAELSAHTLEARRRRRMSDQPTVRYWRVGNRTIWAEVPLSGLRLAMRAGSTCRRLPSRHGGDDPDRAHPARAG